MSTRVTSLPIGHVDGATRDIEFTLRTADGEALDLVAEFSVAARIVTRLAPMVEELRKFIGGHGPSPVETIEESDARHDLMQDRVILQLKSRTGVLYEFALARAGAARLGRLLQSESERSLPSGRA